MALVMKKTPSESGQWRPKIHESDAPSPLIMGKTRSEPNRGRHHTVAEARSTTQPKADELSMAMSRREILGKARWLHMSRGTYEARGSGAVREKEMLHVIRNEVLRDVLAAVRSCRGASSFASALRELDKASRQKQAISAERQRRIAAHLAVARPRAKAAGTICKWLEEVKDGRQKRDAGWSMLRNICLEAADESCTLDVGDNETPVAGEASRAIMRLRRQRSSSQPSSPSCDATHVGSEDPMPPEIHPRRVIEAIKQKRRRVIFAAPTCANRLPQLKHAETCELTFGR